MEFRKWLASIALAGAATMLAGCPPGETPEDCTQAGDEDGNGFADCEDAVCAGLPQCAQAEDCDNGADDDGDGDADCDDAQCAADPACLVAEICDNNQDDDLDGAEDCADFDCAGDPACIEADCNDETDNDEDGLVDCDDADCDDDPICDGVEICNNNLDDDADGLADCDDFDCSTDPACLVEDCDNGVDDDADGQADCDDLDCAADPVCVPATCGNGTIDAGEQCDGADLGGNDCTDVGIFSGGVLACSPACLFDTTGCVAPICGDGIVDAGETCDDGNTVDGDGCAANCQLEGVLTEIEPNDDGTPNVGGAGTNGNDFNADAALNNPIGVFDSVDGGVLIAAALNPAGDEDGFAITNTGANPVQITAETFGPDGLGTCVGIDTEINFRDAAGTELANDDDGGINNCSLETFVLNPGETTFVHVIEFGDNDIETLYFLEVSFAELICGDGNVQAGEGCDDGNNDAGDGCDAVCAVEPGFVCTGNPSVCVASCGDGIINGTDECDGAALGGQSCTTQGFASGTLACATDCTFDTTGCVPIICGDGVLSAGETCDDGNTTIGDGCDDLCQLEGVLTEIEPNDDGTPDQNGGNGNDFNADAALNNPIGVFDTAVGDVIIAAAFNPAGDEDGFAITNTGANPVQITAETFGPDGIGTCVGIDTEINFRDAAGAELANDDDGGINNCSLETFVLNPGETVFAHAIDFLDNTQVNLYFLQLRFAELVCGNGLITAGETCDDGNNADGDGCDAVCAIEPGFTCSGAPSVCVPACGNGAIDAGETCDDGNNVDGDGCAANCQIENVLTEIEPNDDGTPNVGGGGTNGNDFNADAALNNPIGILDTAAGNVLISAALNPAGDEDGFAIANTGANPVQITAETFGPDGLGTCVGIDTEINFRDAAGTELANDDDGGINACSLETFVLNPGETTFVHVIDFGDSDIENLYFLQLRFVEVICGNGNVQAGEGCDDGNNDAGDGCDAVCAVEPGFVCTGNPSVCVASCGDGVINGTDECDGAALGGQSCTTQGFASGTLACATDCTFDTTGCVPIICGDGVLSAGETCDDGNTADNDGCSSLCQIENIVTEIEPNDDGTPNLNGGNGNDFNADAALNNPVGVFDAANGDVLIAAALNPAGDEDGFAITNTGANPVQITAETFGPDGVGTCVGIDTEINFRNAAGAELANDDEGGINSCSLEIFVLNPGETTFVHVIDFLDNTQVNLYFLQLRFAELVCGNGIVQTGETCDDGNNDDGDGCAAVCAIEPGFTCAGNPSVCEPFFSCNPGETLLVIPASNVPVAIPDNPDVQSVISVADAGTIIKAFVAFDNLTHTFDGDLDISIRSPANTTVELTTDNGAGGDNFIGTVFDEECPVAITAGVAPFSGCFNPEGDLNAFGGQSITGDWTLLISDDAAGDTGSLNAWTLAFCVQ